MGKKIERKTYSLAQRAKEECRQTTCVAKAAFEVDQSIDVEKVRFGVVGHLAITKAKQKTNLRCP